jgi:hypothetical protein
MSKGVIPVQVDARSQNSVQVSSWEIGYNSDKVFVVLHGADGSGHPFQFDRAECMGFARQRLDERVAQLKAAGSTDEDVRKQALNEMRDNPRNDWRAG